MDCNQASGFFSSRNLSKQHAKKWSNEKLDLNPEVIGLQPPIWHWNRVQRVWIDLWWRFYKFSDLSFLGILSKI